MASNGSTDPSSVEEEFRELKSRCKVCMKFIKKFTKFQKGSSVKGDNSEVNVYDSRKRTVGARNLKDVAHNERMHT